MAFAFLADTLPAAVARGVSAGKPTIERVAVGEFVDDVLSDACGHHDTSDNVEKACAVLSG